MTWPTVRWEGVPVVSGAAMRAADQEAAARYQIASAQLMEIAGFQLARFLGMFLGGVGGRRITVVAGSGNNGGDALVAARHLHDHGAAVTVRLASPPPRGLGAGHLRTAEALGIPVEPIEAPAPADRLGTVVVDGILGTGVRLPLRADAAAAIAALNALGQPTIAVDVPSGLDADSGEGADRCVRATATVTLGLPKPALRSTPATGRLFVADIGLPPALFGDREASVRRLFEEETLVEVV